MGMDLHRCVWRRLGLLLAIAVVSGSGGLCRASAQQPNHALDGAHIPGVTATALDGHTVTLPHDLPARATVLIVGYGRHSADATTAWEKPTRTQLAQGQSVGFYDMAMLAEIPGFMRSVALHAIRKKVPDVLKPNFLPLFDHEDEWKHTTGYDGAQPDAAYIVVVDRGGAVRWATHEPFSPEAFARLRTAAQQVPAP